MVSVEIHSEGISNPDNIGLEPIPTAEQMDWIKRTGEEPLMEVILPGGSVGYEFELIFSKAGYNNVTFFINDKYDLNSDNNRFTKGLFINCANGCFNEGICVIYGDRVSNSYCASSGEMLNQKINDEECSNNYECKTNLCISNQCVSENLLQKIINWFRRLFGGK